MKIFQKKVCKIENYAYLCIRNAEIAQLVEHDLAKVGVASSSLVFRSTRMTRKVILFFVAARAGRRGRVSVPPPRTVPQPVFKRHQIDLRPVLGTATLPTGAPEASRRDEGVIYRLFGTATLPTGTSVASPRGKGGFWPAFGTTTLPTGTSGASRRGEGGFWTVFGTATPPRGISEPSSRDKAFF